MTVLERAWHWLGLGSAPPSTRDHSRHHHSPRLVPGLERDHDELLALHAEIERLATDGRFTALPAALAGYRSKFDLHILNENLSFYGYVEDRAAGRPDDAELVRGFRSEMNKIARAVANFIKKYRSLGVEETTVQEFLVELRQVGLLLLKRIEREERELYPLYRP